MCHISLRLTPVASIVISIGFAAIVLAVVLFFDMDEQVIELLLWIELQGQWALLWFILIMSMVVLLLLPGVLFTTGAGFVFGVLQGTAVVVIGTTLGAALAFIIARKFWGVRTRDFVLSNNRLNVISGGVAKRGFIIVLLTRLIPFFPSKLSNYFFGLTRVSMPDFVCASFLGFIPFSLHNVYLGSIVVDIATLGIRNIEQTPLGWGLYGVGFLLTIGLVLYLHKLANRLLAKNLIDQQREQSNAEKSADDLYRD